MKACITEDRTDWDCLGYIFISHDPHPFTPAPLCLSVSLLNSYCSLIFLLDIIVVARKIWKLFQ